MQYRPENIEEKWQLKWEEQNAFVTPTDIEILKTKPKYYILDMFPYPSGTGLHVGHPEGYTATDVLARLKRMQGFHVLHPMGWDAFGLPAERAAMRENIHPAKITKRNTDNFRAQIKRLGFSYDWSREINTTSPDYYKWTQWLFLKLHEKGLAYMAEVPVNWCPALGTVLANEEVKDGKYIETGDLVERRLMKQWMLKITSYAEQLLEGLDDVDWPEGIKEMQRNWIGKSSGARVQFKIQDSAQSFDVFTTRPDTLFGATYCVLAPEHPLLESIVTAEQQDALQKYVTISKNKSDMDRAEVTKEKTGVFTGAYAINPVNQQPIPIWVADYVLMTYGTGAIMAVPAHDERDHQFALQFSQKIIEVVSGAEQDIQKAAFTNTTSGQLINSSTTAGLSLNGLSVADAKEKTIQWLEDHHVGKKETQYRLRDWLFSRQRYWGEPFPIVHTVDGEAIPLAAELLPVKLPNIDAYKPTADGRPPLARASKEWLEVTLEDGRKATRETNTMPQWAGSCWYYLRYLDPNNSEAPWAQELENYWMPVDLYIGGVEHAVLHLLYARFWHKVFFDCGLVSTKEPFQKLFNQGMILAYSYKDDAGKYYYPEDVEKKEGKWFTKDTGVEVYTKIEKMSKSKLNVVSPDVVVAQYGADAMRLYELFMGPLEQVKPWQMKGVEGVYRFLSRLWRLVVDTETENLSAKLTDEAPASQKELNRVLHTTIKKVKEDTEALRFNTAIAQMMTFVNAASSAKSLPKAIIQDFISCVCPYVPHIAEELSNRLGSNELLSLSRYPTAIESFIEANEITLALQVNGKRRDEMLVSKNLDKAGCEKKALESEKVQKFLEGKTVRKVIVVPGRLVNIVAN